MKRKRFTEEQITDVLRQHEAGTPTTHIYRQLGVSEAKFYLSKKKYAHIAASQLLRLRQLREENTRSKRLVADPTLDEQTLTDVVKKRANYDMDNNLRIVLSNFSNADWPLVSIDIVLPVTPSYLLKEFCVQFRSF